LIAPSGCFLFETDEADDGYIFEPTSLNSAPVALVSNAPHRTLLGEAVSLSGEESYDPEGTAISYRWDFQSRPAESAATLAGADQMVVSFVADVTGPYTVRLTVSDGELSASTTASLVATPLPTVTALEPNHGTAGTVVKIVGMDFQWDFSEDAVYFNGVEAVVTGFTPTWLIMAAPTSTTGPVELVTMGHTVMGPVFTYDDDTPQFGVNLMANPSFESATLVGSLPDDAGYWQGDVTESVDASDPDASAAGITPADGQRMLKFIATTVGAASPQWTNSELFQSVDLQAFAADIAAGDVVIEIAAKFNRVVGDAETDTRFAVVAQAYSGDPSTLLDQWRNGQSLAQRSVGVTHDQPGTWLPASFDMTLPAQTGFVLVWLAAVEDIVNDGTAPEYDGHFADAASLIVRQP
jgi:hypothetical protein